MNTARYLKVLIDIFFFLLTVTLIGVLLLQIFVNGGNKAISINGELILWADMGMKYWLLFALGAIISILYIASIYYLRKAVIEMIEGETFNSKTSNFLRRSGSILVILSILSIVTYFLQMVSDAQITFGFEGSLSKSDLFTIIIGLFLILTSEVINKGITMKSENDLTI